MYCFTRSVSFFLLFIIIWVGISCNNEKKAEPPSIISKDPKVEKLKLPSGFQADHLYSPSENGMGSWVSMTFDDKGRMIASDQYGTLYRIKVPPIGDTGKLIVEKLNIYNAIMHYKN